MTGYVTHHRVSRGGATPAPAEREAANGARTADYIADIFLIALLASPFVLLESPATMPEAIIAAQAAGTPAASAPSSTPVVPAAAVAP